MSSPPTQFVAAREKASPHNNAIIATLVIGAIAGAMANGVISTTLGQPSFLEYFGFVELNGENTSLIGAALGVFFTGSLFGLYYQSYVADRFGRRASLASAATTSIVSGALLAGSVHIAMFLVFRCV
jgi:MFS family permease